MQTERNIWLRVLSMILTLALLISCVPNQVYALAGEALADLLEATDTVVLQSNATPDPVLSTAKIVAEDESRRGESYKEYIMNNGLRLATVYPSAIHYEDNGQWKDIDNTLVSAVSGGKAVYQNKAGAWNVHFPQSLSGNDMIGITKDGHTVKFGMAGEMRSTGDLVVASVGQIGATADALAVSNTQTATAQIQQIDLTAVRAAAEHPETVLDKLNSRLSYANVYPNTNIVYDLQGNQLKESMVLQRYDASLWGYRYTLNTGDLVPILREDQQIDLCDPETNEVILTMPAPYMLDNNSETSYDVEVALTRNGSNYLLSYYLPREWLAESDRAWPVILDPVVEFGGNYANVDDITVAENYNEEMGRGVIQCGHYLPAGAMRMYMQFLQLPSITAADVIVDATIRLNKPYDSDDPANIYIHKVTESWSQETISWANQPDFGTNIEDYVVCQAAGHYTWNITKMVRDWYEIGNYGMVFKTPSDVEDTAVNNWKQFYSSEYSLTNYYIPLLTITYQNHNGLEDYWSYSSASAGRAGTGYVDLFTGNLVWVRGDLGFDGNRMPVSISHVYNSNDSQRNDFGMGYGWRTNFNQTISIPDPETVSEDNIFVWEDGDGTRHYFYPAKDSEGNEISNTYLDEDGLHLTLTTGGSGNQTYTLTDQYGNKSYFDTSGRLRKMENNQQTKSNISITYTTTASKLIDTITDGAGRVYQFQYQTNLLNRISYQGNGNTELAYVSYAYTAEIVDGETRHYLTKVTDRDGCYTAYAYAEHLLTTAYDVSLNPLDDGYYIDVEYYATFSYEKVSDGAPITPVREAKEYKSIDLDDSLSGRYTFEYFAHYTKVTDIEGKNTNYQFNDFGNLVAVHNSDGHVQYTKYAINDVRELNNNDNSIPLTAELHQVLEVSDIDGTSSNQISNSSFENMEGTGVVGSNPFGWGSQTEVSTTRAYRGNQSMKLSSDAAPEFSCAFGPNINIEPGETYTFSAYIYAESNGDGEPSAYINFGNGKVCIVTDETNGWTRVQISHTNESTETKDICPELRVFSGDLYIDCVQIEKAGTASPYNEVANGEFMPNDNSGGVWVDPNNTFFANYYRNTDAPNLVLSTGSVGFAGNPTQAMYLEQHVPVSGVKGDSFVLSGWAQANVLPLTGNRQFGLKLIFHNLDTERITTEYYVSFDPDISSGNWQYAALTAVADYPFSFITIQLIYNYQANDVNFDGIQLTAGRAGNTYTYDVNKNVVEETNIWGQITKYEYHDNGVDLKKIEPSVGSIVKYEVYDAYHNVINMKETVEDESKTEHTVTYEYAYDEYGNVTSVTVTQGTLKMKSMTEYTSDRNYVKATTDGTGKTTRYGYHLQTGVLKWVQYPEDTPGTADTEDAEGTEGTEPTEYIENTPDTRTYYAYDEMFRLIETYVTTDQNNSMLVEYGYEIDLLKTLTTRSTIYSFTYNDYNLRTSVSIGNQQLATYTYNNKHYLTQLDFANEDSVKYSYDSLGRVTREEYYEGGNTTTTPSRTIRYYYDCGGALARMKDSATGIETVCVYDYAGRVLAYSEFDGDTYREIVYTYDSNGNVTKVNETVDEHYLLRGEPRANRSVYGYKYFYDYKNRLECVKTNDAQKEYQYDELDRLTKEVVSEVVKMGEGEDKYEIITEVFENEYSYHNATVGGTSVTTNQVESKTTTAAHYTSNLVYTYDDNGNITAIRDGTGANAKEITYEYDSANQLTRENNPYKNRTWVWTYDAAGNITLKEEYSYTTVATDDLVNPIDSIAYAYGNGDWGDLLTAYDGRSITYDEIGNPLSDGIWTYTWKQGRQLATMSRILEDNSTESWTYTYDANGMRLSRSSGTDADDVTYTYVYTDGLLTRMTIGDMMLYFTYDAAGTPMTMSIHTGSNCAIGSETGCGADCTTYYYVTNLQGDVIAILDDSGTAITLYQYDAWGYPTLTLDVSDDDIGTINPLRYRGYVYDHETGLYYLQSRYYNPEIGRFISADSHASTGQGFAGYNMFAYCNNNPVVLCDNGGESATIAGGIVGGVCGFLGALISEATDDNDGIRWNKVMQCTASSAIAGAVAGFVADVSIATFGAGTAILIAAGAGMVCSGVNSMYTQTVLTGDFSWGKVASDAIIGGITNGLCTGTSSVLKPLVKGAKAGIGHAVKAGVKYTLTQVSFELTPGLLNVGSFIAVDLVPTVITGFGGLLWGMAYDYVVGGPL